LAGARSFEAAAVHLYRALLVGIGLVEPNGVLTPSALDKTIYNVSGLRHHDASRVAAT
jgi:hypothetical protein